MCELVEQGKILFYSRPTGPSRNSADWSSVSAAPGPNWPPARRAGATTPAPGPRADGRAAPNRLRAELSRRAAGLGACGARAPRTSQGAAPAGLANGLRGSRGPGHGGPGPDRGARGRVYAGGRTVARLPAPPDDPGVGPTVGAILLAEIGDIAWFTQFSQLRKLAGLDIVRVQSGQFAGQARISKCGRGLLRWALYHAAMGLARTATGRARLAALESQAAGRSLRGLQGDRRVGGEGAPDRLGRVAERDPVRSHADRRALPPAALSGDSPDWKIPSSPGSRQRDITTWRLLPETAGGHWRAAPLSRARTRPGGPLGAASRPDGTTTMGRERFPWGGLGGRRQRARA